MQYHPDQLPRQYELRAKRESGQELTAEELREYRELIAAQTNFLLEGQKNGRSVSFSN
jgi:hypothetical protein